MEGDVDSITWNPVTTPLIMSQKKENKGRPADSGLQDVVVVDLKDLGEIVVEGREWSRRLSDLEDIALVTEVDFIFGIRIEFCYDN